MQSVLTKHPIIAGFTIVMFAVITRIMLPPAFFHLPNFSPINAIALCCGAYFASRRLAILTVLMAVWLSDLVIGYQTTGHWTWVYEGFYWQYGCYLLIASLGTKMHGRMTSLTAAFAGLGTACLFFVISNFGVWFSAHLYPTTWDGLITCYIAAIPFFKYSLLSDVFYALCFVTILNVLGMNTALFAHKNNHA